jgi:hypothetical protein
VWDGVVVIARFCLRVGAVVVVEVILGRWWIGLGWIVGWRGDSFLGGSWGLASGGWVGLGYLSGMGRCVVDGGKVRLMFFSFFLMDIQVLYVVVLGRLGERE